MDSGFLDPNLWKQVSQYGFGGLIFLLLAFVLWHVLKQQKIILTAANEERVKWQEILAQERETTAKGLADVTKVLDAHTNSAREYHRAVREAHGYQREEHNKMVESLNNICQTVKLGQKGLENAVEGFKNSHESRAKEAESILESTKQVVANCTECGKLLMSINGRIDSQKKRHFQSG